jgi:hypothetical protein
MSDSQVCDSIREANRGMWNNQNEVFRWDCHFGGDGAKNNETSTRPQGFRKDRWFTRQFERRHTHFDFMITIGVRLDLAALDRASNRVVSWFSIREMDDELHKSLKPDNLLAM